MLNNKYVKLFLTLGDDNSHWFYFLFVVLMLYWSPGGKTTAKLKYIILHEFIIINQFLNLVLIHQGMSTCLSVTYCRIKIWTTLGWYFLERTAVVEAGKGKRSGLLWVSCLIVRSVWWKAWRRLTSCLPQSGQDTSRHTDSSYTFKTHQEQVVEEQIWPVVWYERKITKISQLFLLDSNKDKWKAKAVRI